MNGTADKSKILSSFDLKADTQQCCTLQAEREIRETDPIPVAPHTVARGRSAHPWALHQESVMRVWPTLARITPVHVYASITLTCMGSKHWRHGAAAECSRSPALKYPRIIFWFHADCASDLQPYYTLLDGRFMQPCPAVQPRRFLTVTRHMTRGPHEVNSY